MLARSYAHTFQIKQKSVTESSFKEVLNSYSTENALTLNNDSNKKGKIQKFKVGHGDVLKSPTLDTAPKQNRVVKVQV